MGYSFNEIMAYHPDNKNVYDEIRDSLSHLVPFIGAGLTKFAYFSWPEALTELSQKITDINDNQRVSVLIKDEKLFDAAQLLEDLRGPANLARDIGHLFSADRLVEKHSDLHKEAISLLPVLFPGLILTTNFEQTIETVYKEQGKSLEVLHPGHTELLSQFLRQTGNSLFKLHGSVSGNYVEYNRIIFTQKQYDLHYGRGTPLATDLKKCLKGKAMLFLGCSLRKDRTMQLLQEVVEPGEYHYAIINCKKSERDKKIRELEPIRTILYEDDHHEAVRIILEHLLEEIQPNLYKFLPFHMGALKLPTASNRFAYSAEIIPLIGREKELEELNKFLSNPNISFQWWTITGPAGSGKSRLAYEFQKSLTSGWFVYYLKSKDYENLASIIPHLTQRTLLIADYVHSYASELGKWMEFLREQKRGLPLRMLLIERQSGNNSWVKQLYSSVRHEQELMSCCYKNEFLTLLPLSNNNLLDIIGYYASALRPDDGNGNVALSNSTKQLLLQRLKSIDPELCRPLYALFLTDAYMEGASPEYWNRKEVLGYVINREHKRLYFNVIDVMGRADKKLAAACTYLQCIATVLQSISINNLQEICPHIWKIIEDKAVNFEAPLDILERVGLAIGEEIPAVCPDLVGEYFVLDWLYKQKKTTIDKFLSEIWRMPKLAVVFYIRVLDDYIYLLEEHPTQWEILLPNTLSLSEDASYFYAVVLVGAIGQCCVTVECKRLTNTLRQLASQYSNSKTLAILLAKGICNLIPKLNEDEIEEALKWLEPYTISYPHEWHIVIELIRGLVNLSIKQNLHNSLQTIERLKKLVVTYSYNPEAIIELARCLTDLVTKQAEPDCLETIDQLNHLTIDYPYIPELFSFLSGSLVNLSAKQDVHGILETTQRIESILSIHTTLPDVAANLSKCLFNLSLKQDRREMLKTLSRLEKLASDYPGNLEIAENLTRLLLNTSLNQDECSLQASINKIILFAESFPYSLDIIVCLANSLANLIAHQNIGQARKTINLLNKLALTYSKNARIMVEVAQGLFNLSCIQKASDMEKTAEQVEKLVLEYPLESDIVDYYAKILINLTDKQNVTKRKKTIQLLANLYASYPNMHSITVKYAIGLVNLSSKQNLKGLQETVAQLQQLVKFHPDLSELSIYYARTLANLGRKQNKYDLQKTLILLKELNTSYPDIPELKECFAQGLLYMIYRQDYGEARDNVQKLKELVIVQPNAPEIAVIYAHALDYLCCMQDEQGILKVTHELERLLIRYPSKWKIAVIYLIDLAKLESKQDTENALKTREKIEQLLIDYPVLSKVKIRINDKTNKMDIKIDA